jgi:hypothetical protein
MTQHHIQEIENADPPTHFNDELSSVDEDPEEGGREARFSCVLSMLLAAPLNGSVRRSQRVRNDEQYEI